MRPSYKELQLVLRQNRHETACNEEVLELAFDDEPLAQILYGKKLRGPTPANSYLPARKQSKCVLAVYAGGQITEALQLASAIGRTQMTISYSTCHELLGFLEKIVPYQPKVIRQHDLSGMGELLRILWETALQANVPALQKKAGALLAHWYQHYGKHADARQIFQKMIEIYHEEGDHASEAGMINGLGFEYLLEEKWEEAAPHFEKAAAIFQKIGVQSRYANALANYWTCRIESDDLQDLEESESLLQKIACILAEAPYWQRRKPLILLAKMKERQGDVEAAIALVERAIETTRGNPTLYTAIDQDYLRHLRKRINPI